MPSAAFDNADKKLALILANYPMSEGRIGNGVGLDTPASVVGILSMLRDEGYRLAGFARRRRRAAEEAHRRRDQRSGRARSASRAAKPRARRLSRCISTHCPPKRASAERALGSRPEQDPTLRRGRFMIAGWRCGQVFVGIQPSRSRERGDYASYHDAELVPPHAYLAFYFWLRHAASASMQSCMSASTAIWNGCRARAWR